MAYDRDPCAHSTAVPSLQLHCTPYTARLPRKTPTLPRNQGTEAVLLAPLVEGSRIAGGE